jgi:hypothetical protein
MHRKKSFLDIFAVELQDLDEDIQMLIDEYNQKHDKGKITNYVWMENIALMRNELTGVESFISEVKRMNADNYETVDALIDDLRGRIKKRVEEKGLAESVIMLIDRKIKKVSEYIKIA